MLVLLGGVITLSVLAFLHQRKRICEEIAVTISYDGEHKPVTEKEVTALIERSGIKALGIEEHMVDMAALYDTLGHIPFVKTVKPIYFSGNTLNINLELHNLVAHIYPAEGSDFYICEDGTLLPYSPRIKEQLPVACGAIPQRKAHTDNITNAGKTINRIYAIAKLITADEFYKAQFKQIYVNSDKEFELIASVGKHTILLGDGENAEEQLSHLRTAYNQGIAFMEPDKYNQLDLRYKNRIIAKKRL